MTTDAASREERRRGGLAPVPATLLAIVSVQGGSAVAKGLFPVLGTTATATVRMGLAAVMLLLVFRPRVRSFDARQWRLVIAYGIVLAAMTLVFYRAIERIPLGLAVTLEFLGPLTLAVAGSRRAIDFLWAALAGAGVVLIAPWSGASVDVTGALLALLTGVFWAAYIVLGSRVSRVMAGGPAVALGLTIAAVCVAPFGIADGGLTQLTPSLFAVGVAVALFSSALPFTLEMAAMSALPARTFSILMSLEPAVAAICGLVFLREHLTVAQWSAVALVIVASAGASAAHTDV